MWNDSSFLGCAGVRWNDLCGCWTLTKRRSEENLWESEKSIVYLAQLYSCSHRNKEQLWIHSGVVHHLNRSPGEWKKMCISGKGLFLFSGCTTKNNIDFRVFARWFYYKWRKYSFRLSELHKQETHDQKLIENDWADFNDCFADTCLSYMSDFRHHETDNNTFASR